jgi:hypothetical protein
MRKAFFITLLLLPFVSTVAQSREATIKFSPGWGYMALLDDKAMNIRKFPDLMLNLEAAVEGTAHLYPMLEVMYAHSSRKDTWFSGGLDMIGIGIGLKILVKPADYVPETDDLLDRTRYWFSVAPGPYITTISSSSGGVNAGTTKVSFGIDIGAGIEYYFLPNLGIGGQAKLIYVGYSDDYLLLNFGPSIVGRF